MKTIEKKAAILKAARDIFGRYGYEKTSLEDIGRVVGLNKASLYHYFENKAAIFSDIVNQESKEFAAMLSIASAEKKSPGKKIIKYLLTRAEVTPYFANLYVLIHEPNIKKDAGFSVLFNLIHQKEINLIQGIIELGIENKIFIETNSEQVAKVLLTFADALEFKNFRANNPKERLDKKLEELRFAACLILAGIKKK